MPSAPRRGSAPTDDRKKRTLSLNGQREGERREGCSLTRYPTFHSGSGTDGEGELDAEQRHGSAPTDERKKRTPSLNGQRERIAKRGTVVACLCNQDCCSTASQRRRHKRESAACCAAAGIPLVHQQCSKAPAAARAPDDFHFFLPFPSLVWPHAYSSLFSLFPGSSLFLGLV